MKKNQLPQLLVSIQNCKLHGRKLSRYLCANANIIAQELTKENVEFDKAVVANGFEPKLIRAIQDRLYLNDETEIKEMSPIMELKTNSPDQFELFQKFEMFRVAYFEQESTAKIIPIPERFLPNSTTLEDRFPIESLIKIPKI